MPIPNITTNISNASVKFLSGLSNNSDSLVPMMVKDVLSDSTLVYTYSKEGGKDDVREKAIEEFGTGAIWLYMIPAIKWAIDKTIYPLLKLNSDFDPNLIISQKDIDSQKAKQAKISNPILKKIFGFFDDGINRESTKNVQDNLLLKSKSPVLADEKALFENLNKPNEVLSDFFKNHNLFKNFKAPTNAQLYKGLTIGKFAVATTAAGIALIKIINYKQKSTEERINRDINKKQNASKVLINKTINSDALHQNFTSKIKETKNNQPSFTGLDKFMTNPILNTLILDGVITSTRLAKARPGEKAEVGLKELFQLVFTYGLALPIQKGFEKFGKAIDLPISLDPKVLFEKDLDSKLENAKGQIKTIEENVEKSGKDIIEQIYKTSADSDLINLLEKNGTLSTVEKDGKKAISYLNPIKEKDLKETFKNIKDLAKNSKNLNKIKAFKVFAVIGNILIAIGVMGVLQPMATIWMRKLMSNGGKDNLAITKIEQEKQKGN